MVEDVNRLETAHHPAQVRHTRSERRPYQLVAKTYSEHWKRSILDKFQLFPEPLPRPGPAEKVLGPAQEDEAGLHLSQSLGQTPGPMLNQSHRLTRTPRQVNECLLPLLPIPVIADQNQSWFPCHRLLTACRLPLPCYSNGGRPVKT